MKSSNRLLKLQKHFEALSIKTDFIQILVENTTLLFEMGFYNATVSHRTWPKTIRKLSKIRLRSQKTCQLCSVGDFERIEFVEGFK